MLIPIYLALPFNTQEQPPLQERLASIKKILLEKGPPPLKSSRGSGRNSYKALTRSRKTKRLSHDCNAYPCTLTTHPTCPRHGMKLTFSAGWYGTKAECSGCLRDGCPQGDFAVYGKPSARPGTTLTILLDEAVR
jgi:hypothetical protein